MVHSLKLALAAATLFICSAATTAQAGEDSTLAECSLWTPFDTGRVRELMKVASVRGASIHGYLFMHHGVVPGTFTFPEGAGAELALWQRLPGIDWEGSVLFSTMIGNIAAFSPDKGGPAFARVNAGSGYIDARAVDSETVGVDTGSPPRRIYCTLVTVSDGHRSRSRVLVTSDDNGDPLGVEPMDLRPSISGGGLADIIKNKTKNTGKEGLDEPATIQEELGRISGSGASEDGKKAAPPEDDIGAIIKESPVDTPATVSVAAPISPTAPMAPPVSAVCTGEEGKTAALPTNIDPKGEGFAVGWRNEKTRAQAFDFSHFANIAIAKDFKLDIADSVGQLLVYQPIAPPSETTVAGNKMLPASVRGVNLSRALPDAAASVPITTLKIVIVGAPEEVALSGLDRVAAALDTRRKDGIAFDVQWYGVDRSGAISPPEIFTSLGDVVKAAAAQADGYNFVGLNEVAFAAFMDNFEQMLTAQKEPLDRIFWIKSAYSLPATTPVRLQKFINAVSGSAAIHHRPNGDPAQWLTIVSAFVGDFSLAYLRQPVADAGIGEVFEEKDNMAKPRQFIGDPNKVATDLAVLAKYRAGSKGAAPNVPRVNDTLALDANAIFDSRGYLLSKDGAAALVTRVNMLNDLLQESLRRPGKRERSRPAQHCRCDTAQRVGGFCPTQRVAVMDQDRP